MSDDNHGALTNNVTDEVDKVTDSEKHKGFLTPERGKEAQEERKRLKKDA